MIIGEQDERMFMYFEDVDWSFRLLENNLQMHYFPKFKAIHYGGQTTSTKQRSLAMHRIYQASLRVFCQKHIFPKHGFLYNLLLKVLMEVRYFVIYLTRIAKGGNFVGGAGYKKFTVKNDSNLPNHE